MASTTLKHLKIKRSTRQITQELMPFALLFISLIFFSCKKDNPTTLPPATQNGSNTMGAYINNVVWVPAPSFYSTGIQADYGIPLFNIWGLTENSDNVSKTGVYIYIYNFNGAGTYILNSSPWDGMDNNSGGVSIGTGTTSLTYVADNSHLGSVTITHFDQAQKIVSGTFKMTLVNENNPSDTIKITNGRFDVRCPLDNQY